MLCLGSLTILPGRLSQALCRWLPVAERMPDAAREFNIFLPQICGGQCGPRSLQSTPRLQTAYGLVCGRNTRRGNAIVFSIREVVVSSRRKAAFGKDRGGT